MFGPYVVEAEVARAPRAAVLRGCGPDGQPVALKLLLGASPKQYERFGRERALLAELDETKGFVGLLDVLDTPHGPCLVMPFLPGGTLRDRIRRHGMPIHEVARLGRRLAGSMGRAHARGIVHRDLKPENVLFDARGEALIADLGLAKHLGESSRVENSLTRSGELHGTPGYMAPEQIRSARDVGPAADVFALGAILYECLTGAAPFAGDGPLDVLARTSSGSFVGVLEARPEAPDWLAAVIERCLAADPAARFDDGAALAAAIAQGPLQGRRRSSAALAIAGTAFVAAVVVAAVLLVGGEPAATGGDAEPTTSSPPAPTSKPAPVAPDEPEVVPTTEAAPAEQAPSLGVLERMIRLGRDGSWEITRPDEALVLENREGRGHIKYYYAGFRDEPPFRFGVDVKVEATPGAAPPAGGGIVYGLDEGSRTYWAILLTAQGELQLRQRTRGFDLRASSRVSTPGTDGWHRLEVLDDGKGFTIFVDGQRGLGMGGRGTARKNVGITAVGQGRFSFRRVAAATEAGREEGR